MRYFLDTEFLENGPGKPIWLLSVGIVAQDGREFYAINAACPVNEANDWVATNVIPKLEACGTIARESPAPPPSHFYGSPAQIRSAIQVFCAPDRDEHARTKPEFWGYYADYDWVVFAQLFGRMVDLPKGWPMYCRDIKQLADERGIGRLPPQAETEHNALFDARWNRQAWVFCQQMVGLPTGVVG